MVKKEAVTKLQALQRGKAAKEQQRALEEEQRMAVTKLQALQRGKAAKEQVKQQNVQAMTRRQEEAATKLQALQRGNARKQFCKMVSRVRETYTFNKPHSPTRSNEIQRASRVRRTPTSKIKCRLVYARQKLF